MSATCLGTYDVETEALRPAFTKKGIWTLRMLRPLYWANLLLLLSRSLSPYEELLLP